MEAQLKNRLLGEKVLKGKSFSVPAFKKKGTEKRMMKRNLNDISIRVKDVCSTSL